MSSATTGITVEIASASKATRVIVSTSPSVKRRRSGAHTPSPRPSSPGARVSSSVTGCMLPPTRSGTADPWPGQTREMTRTLVLALHISAVAAWLGANFVQLVLSPRFAKGPADFAAAWTRHTIWLGERYYVTAGVIIGVTGVVLVLDGDWSWTAGFVWVGISVVATGATLGGAVFGPLARRRAAALDSGDESAAAELQRRIVGFALLDTALVLAAIVAMVHRWQA